MPLLRPGYSLRFALLPEGQDPDDLSVRRGGGDARSARGARPLVETLWQRESENANLETPERRAALEARLAISAHDPDETVRRYYRES